MNKAWQILIRVSGRLAMLNCFKFAPWGRIGNYTDLLQTGANVMNKLFPGSWNNTLWWIKRSHVFLVNPSNLIISAWLKFVYDIGYRSRASSQTPKSCHVACRSVRYREKCFPVLFPEWRLHDPRQRGTQKHDPEPDFSERNGRSPLLRMTKAHSQAKLFPLQLQSGTNTIKLILPQRSGY